MNPRLTLNLLMLAGVLALLAVVFYKPGIAPVEELPPLTTLNREQIKRIEIVRATDGLTLERVADGWQVAGTPPLPADPYQVDALLALVEARPQRSYPAATLNLATLKLAPAQLTLRLDDTTLLFGDTDPLQGLRYVQSGDQVHLLMDNYQSILQGRRTQFASRKLLPEGASIVAIEAPQLKLSKQNGAWHIEPRPEKLSADAPQQLLQAWNNASALWVRDYQQADSQPLSVTLADGQRIVFELRQGDGEYVLARPDLGVQYQLTEDVAQPLLELQTPVAEAAPQATPAAE